MVSRRGFLVGAAGLAAARLARADVAVGGARAGASRGDHGDAPRADHAAAPLAVALRLALERAQARRRKLLVLVAYDEDDRDRLLGRWISNGADVEVAPLAQLEVAAATMADLHEVAPVVPDTPIDPPLLVLLDPRRMTAEVFDGGTPWLGERAERARGPYAPVTRVQACARWVADRAPATGDAHALARVARARWSARRIPGSRWAHTTASDCGENVEVEDETDEERSSEIHSMIGCGMGGVPTKSVRFLQFLTRR